MLRMRIAHMQKLIAATAILALSLCLASCEHMPIGYDVPVDQGNVIHPDSLSQLKIGMSREQVADIMGEPVVVNTFDTRCWHYVYTSASRKKQFEKKNVTLIFEQDRLVKVIQ